MRDVRHVSAALPHLSPHARRGRIAARPHLADPGHEQRAPLVLPRTRRAPRSLPRLPRVRVGLSVGRALRRDHRWRTGTGRRRLYRFGRALRLAQRGGLQTLARRVGLRGPLARLEALLPPLSRITLWRDFYPARGEVRGEVALFIGCVSDLAERAVLETAVQLLNRLGYGVHVPP